MPVTIKDNIAVRGWTNHRGSAVTPREPMTEDAPAVARLREAGAVFLGKTTMPEYGWKGVGDSPLSGITRNPWNTATGPGGSSAGAAVCAALNVGCIHIGTDGAGSIRIPGAFTGVFGIKSTYGRVPAYPVSTMGFLAHVGPLTRTVEDAAIALSVIGQPDAARHDGLPRARRRTTASASPTACAGCASPGRRGWDMSARSIREIAALTARAAHVFAALGAVVEEVGPRLPDPLETLMTLWSAGAALALRPFAPDQRSRMDPGLVAVAEMGARQPAVRLCRGAALRAQRAVRRRWTRSTAATTCC